MIVKMNFLIYINLKINALKNVLKIQFLRMMNAFMKIVIAYYMKKT